MSQTAAVSKSKVKAPVIAPAVPVLLVRLESLPLDKLIESPTNPRKTFDPLKHKELVANIQARGLKDPILVRPLAKGLFEIVFGHRRVRAFKELGLVTIQANVRDMTDEEVVETQLIELVQAAEVHPMEQAESYKLLLTEHKLSEAEIAARVGKRVPEVQLRLKLCALIAPAKKAYREGKLTHSGALMLARVPVGSQPEALRELTSRGEPLSERDARELLLRHFTCSLKDAGFDTKDATLLPKAGACDTCTLRTGNQRALFSDVKEDDVCTSPKCFHAKRVATWEWQAAKAKEEDRLVIPVKESKALFHSWGQHDLDTRSGWIDLDEVCPEDPRSRTWRRVIGKDLETEKVAIACDPVSITRHLMRRPEARKVAKDHLPEQTREIDPQQQVMREQRAQAKRESAAYEQACNQAIATILDTAIARLNEGGAPLFAPSLLALQGAATFRHSTSPLIAMGKRLGLACDSWEMGPTLQERFHKAKPEEQQMMLLEALFWSICSARLDDEKKLFHGFCADHGVNFPALVNSLLTEVKSAA